MLHLQHDVGLFIVLQVHMVYNVNDVLDFLYYCSYNCRTASVETCRDAAKLLKTSVSDILPKLFLNFRLFVLH